MTKHYHLGLLYLVKLLIDADGVADQKELEALYRIKQNEDIPEDTFREFERSISLLSGRALYEKGIDHVRQCSQPEKLNIFGMLYRLSEVDGRVHAKEIKLLVYSLKTAGVEFDAVVYHAKTLPAIF